MVLIKENKIKNRKVYKLPDRYRKEWSIIDFTRLENHVKIMNKIKPGYVIDYGQTKDIMWLEVAEIKGTLASTVLHTSDFINQITAFCLESIRKTAPYAHGDWVLSNIIIDDANQFHLIDWDNVDIYPMNSVLQKLSKDLKSAFGDKFTGLDRYI